MNHAKTASWRIRILPVGNAGHGCTDCAGYTNGHGGVGCGGELVAATHYLQPFANECCCPSTDGHISEYCVQGMPQPNTVQDVFELVTAGACIGEKLYAPVSASFLQLLWSSAILRNPTRQ